MLKVTAFPGLDSENCNLEIFQILPFELSEGIVKEIRFGTDRNIRLVGWHMDFPPSFSSVFSDIMGPAGKGISKTAAGGLGRAGNNSLLSDKEENLWFLILKR